MKFGLSEDQLRQIREVLSKHPGITEAVIFGSRAMGNYKEASDVDIALKGEVTAKTAMEVKDELEEETDLPFFFDVVAYPTIDNPELREHIDKFGISMYLPGWNESKFSKYVEISPKVPLKSGNEYSFVEMKDLEDGRRYCGPSSKRRLSGGSRFQEGDTLFARITPCLENGKICQVRGLKDGVGFGSTEFFVFRGKEGFTDNDFVFYLSRSDEVRSFAEQNFDGTSGRQRVPKTAFDNLSVLFPPLTEQHAIAAVLTSLDDKIDLLHRQNKTLEGMAAALWRKMFLEEAESGWKPGKLSEEMNITMGQSPPGDTYNEDGNGMIFFQGRAEFGFRFPSTRLFCTAPKRLAKRFDTLVSVRAPVGDVNMALSECCIGRGVAAVRHKADFMSYTYYKIRSLKSEFDSFEQQGTVFGSIGKDEFNGIDTIIPNLETAEQFENLANPLDKQIFLNSIQINKLIDLRDMLLPKLISGEVTVKT